MIKQMAMDLEVGRNNPGLVSDFKTKPWAQFLEGDAPGWLIDWANGSDVIQKQRIPNAAVRIIEHWEKETKDSMDALDEQRGDGVKRWKSGLKEKEEKVTMSKDGKLAMSQSTVGFTLLRLMHLLISSRALLPKIHLTRYELSDVSHDERLS